MTAALAQARRELRMAERRFNEEQRIVQDQASRARLLIDEAIAVGLLGEDAASGMLPDLMLQLQSLRNWQPSQRDEREGGDAFQRALQERERLLEQARALKREIDEAKTVESEQNGYHAELREQRARLDSIGLYQHLNGPNAPPLDASIMAELEGLERELSGIARPSAQLDGFIQARIAARREVLGRIRVVSDTIDALAKQSAESRNLRDADMRRAMVVGKASLFLDSVQQTSDGGKYELRVRDAQSQVNRLEAMFEQTDAEPLTRVAIDSVGQDMSEWAHQLGHEYAGAHWLLDERVGTIQTVGRRGVVRMPQMGGGKNHLGCHLYAHFALHKWFRSRSRPVPSFLFLDRPTIGFYENRGAINDPQMLTLGGADQGYVRVLFDWMADVLKSLNGGLQLIVTEHVDLSDHKVFQDAIVENWWHTNGFLVPPDWTG